MSDTTLLDDLTKQIRENNIICGWYDGIEDRTFGDDCALIHSEVSEALDAYREHGLDDATDHEVYGTHRTEELRLPKPEGVGSEFADVFIRLLDTCDRRGIDLLAETRRKIAYNRTRGYRHGGKRL